jgi:hypothetical protein
MPGSGHTPAAGPAAGVGERWRFSGLVAVLTTPAVVGDAVLCSVADAQVYAVDEETGE